VEKRFVIELPEIAGTIKKAFNPSTCLRSFLGALDISPLILTNAFANFEGFPVNCADPLSAEYSLYLEIALIIRKLIIQVAAATSSMIINALPLFRSSLLP